MSSKAVQAGIAKSKNLRPGRSYGKKKGAGAILAALRNLRAVCLSITGSSKADQGGSRSWGHEGVQPGPSIGHEPWPSGMRSLDTLLSPQLMTAINGGIAKYQYKGIPTLKCPFDLALYSLLLWRVRPRTIIEIGSFRGGSAIWLADQMRAFGLDAHIHSIDVNRVSDVSDPIVTFRQGDANNLEATVSADDIKTMPRPLLVIEDSKHKPETTSAVLDHFAPLMAVGEYIIIEDASVVGLGWGAKFKGGPGVAIESFLAQNSESWAIDTEYCDFYGLNVTWNMNGYLKKIA
jgi:cephalosporin hydroxylase